MEERAFQAELKKMIIFIPEEREEVIGDESRKIVKRISV